MKSCLLFLAVTSLLVFNSCSNKNEKKILIGFSGNLTGRISDLAISGRNGFELAIEKINKEGGINGRQISFLIKDDKNDPEIARKVDNELLNAGVLVTVGHYLSTPAKAVLELFNKNKTLLFSPTISSELFSNIDDYLIKIMGDSKATGEAIAIEAIKDCNVMTATYETTNYLYAQKVYEAFKTKYEELGGKVINTIAFTSGKTNIEKLAKDLLAHHVDGVLSIAGGFDNAIICQKLVSINPKIAIYSGQWSMTEDLISNGGNAVKNLKIAGIIDLNSSNSKFSEFKKNYISKYNQNPTFSSALSYESVMIIAEAIRKINLDDDSKIREMLKETVLNIKNFEGLVSDIEINKYGDADRAFQIFTIRNGKFVKY